MESISEYKDKEFEDSELGKLAIDYISSIEDQREALKYYNSDWIKYSDLWDEAYDKSSEILLELVEKYGLKLNEEDFKELKENAQVVKEESKVSKEIDSMMKSVEFSQVSNDYGWKNMKQLFKIQVIKI